VNLRYTISLLLVLLFICSYSIQVHPSYSTYKLSGKAQGTSYSIQYHHSYEAVSQQEIDSMFSVFDYSLSRYNTASLLSKLNRSRYKAKVDSHLLKVIKYAKEMQMSTNGCFEYRLLPLLNLWGYGNSKPVQVPELTKIQSMLEEMHNSDLNIRYLSIYKSSKSLAIDLDGIAQGYCVDEISSFLKKKGISDFIVELGGELYISGSNNNTGTWQVGVDNNLIIEGKQNAIVLSGMDNVAVTTSGSLQKFKKIGDQYYSHIIDPRTGYPVQNGIVSVTVIAPSAMQADALDNAFMVMGIKDSFEWTRNNPNIGVYFTYMDSSGKIADTANAYFKQFVQLKNAD
jgi:thiamine biosynthesis lipoprotein